MTAQEGAAGVAPTTTTCVYKDCADMEAPTTTTSPSSASTASGNNQSEPMFPVKLHFVLSEMEADGLAHVASWAPHGRCFVIHKQDLFVDKVLRLWFCQTKYTSFQRQLNMYGFRRITNGPDKNGYYHECFLRGKPFLAERMPRMQLKGNGPRRPTKSMIHPDFYSMKFLPTSTTPAATTTAPSSNGSVASAQDASLKSSLSDDRQRLARLLMQATATSNPQAVSPLLQSAHGAQTNPMSLSMTGFHPMLQTSFDTALTRASLGLDLHQRTMALQNQQIMCGNSNMGGGAPTAPPQLLMGNSGYPLWNGSSSNSAQALLEASAVQQQLRSLQDMQRRHEILAALHRGTI